MSDIPAVSNAEPGLHPHRGKLRDGLPLDNYPLSDFEGGAAMMSDNMRKGATGKPINTNPDIVAGDQSVEKFGLARGTQGANS